MQFHVVTGNRRRKIDVLLNEHFVEEVVRKAVEETFPVLSAESELLVQSLAARFWRLLNPNTPQPGEAVARRIG